MQKHFHNFNIKELKVCNSIYVILRTKKFWKNTGTYTTLTPKSWKYAMILTYSNNNNFIENMQGHLPDKINPLISSNVKP
jgi:hypothetical protein